MDDGVDKKIVDPVEPLKNLRRLPTDLVLTLGELITDGSASTTKVEPIERRL